MSDGFNFGLRLKQLRRSLAMKQKDFADSLGIAQATLSNYEQGVSLPTIDFIHKISRAYNVSPNWLLQDETNNESYELIDVIKALKMLYEAPEFELVTHIHEDEKESEKNNIEILIFQSKDKPNNLNKTLYDMLLKINQLTEELRRFEISQTRYDDEMNRLMDLYRGDDKRITRINHSGLTDDIRKYLLYRSLQEDIEKDNHHPDLVIVDKSDNQIVIEIKNKTGGQ